MRLFLFSLFAGCAVSPVVVEGESRLLIGGPDFEDEVVVSSNESAIVGNGASEGSQSEQEGSSSPGVFFPDDIDFDKPVRPEEEPVFEPVPYLYTEQTGLSWYDINGLAISRDGATGMLGMSGGNSASTTLMALR